MKIAGIKFFLIKNAQMSLVMIKLLICNNNDIVFRFRYIVLILINYE